MTGAIADTADWSSEALRLCELLRPHTPFAEAIVRRQCERCGVAPQFLTAEDIPKVGPLVIAAAGVFVDPTVLTGLRRALRLRA
jgi:hypothetical protein